MSTILTPPSIFGVGLAYPFRLDATTGRPKLAKEEDLVKMSMAQILKTRKGERPFLTRNGVLYGTGVTTALFEDVNTALDVVTYEAKAALDVWEPRIVVLEVTSRVTQQSTGDYSIEATIRFKYRSTNRIDNFVVPYRYENPDATV